MKKNSRHFPVLWRLAVISLLILAAVAFFSDRSITGSAIGVVKEQINVENSGTLSVFINGVKEELSKDDQKENLSTD